MVFNLMGSKVLKNYKQLMPRFHGAAILMFGRIQPKPHSRQGFWLNVFLVPHPSEPLLYL